MSTDMYNAKFISKQQNIQRHESRVVTRKPHNASRGKDAPGCLHVPLMP